MKTKRIKVGIKSAEDVFGDAKAAEELRRETLERWEAYETSGKLVSNEAVLTWLDTWGHEGETERPSCENSPA